MQWRPEDAAIAPFLASVGPHVDIGPEQQLFAPFIGSWDLEVEWLENGVVVRAEKGEWHFAWVLEGRAVQDVWIVPPLSERDDRNRGYEYGTSVRFYDPEIHGWRSVWIGPVRRSIQTFVAQRIGAEIVLETALADGGTMRWIFSEIERNSFRWRSQRRSDGVNWELVQQFRARRRASAA